MKKKVLLSSILTIALCLILIAGSTFALFTSKSEMNIAATAGKVEMLASIEDLTLYSAEATAGGNLIDENGNAYAHKQVDTFTNGGSATLKDANLTLVKVTPGDKVSLNIAGVNNSDVVIQYRYIIECVGGYELMTGLAVSINNTRYDSLLSFVSAWTKLSEGQQINDIPVSIELPITAGNEYQEKSAEIRIAVEAVQGNAVVENNTDPVVSYIPRLDTPDAVATALADPEMPAVTITEDMALTITENLSNKTIFAGGNDVSIVFEGALDNVVVSGIRSTTAGNKINVKNASGNLTIVDCKLNGSNGTGGAAIVAGANTSLVIDDCTITGVEKSSSYGIYNSGASGAITITNSVFKGFGSWAIQINNVISGDFTVDGCTFDTPDGVAKALSGVDGNFTFTNNTLIGCAGHDNAGPDALVVSTSKKWTPMTCTGTRTVSGNTLDGATWNP